MVAAEVMVSSLIEPLKNGRAEHGANGAWVLIPGSWGEDCYLLVVLVQAGGLDARCVVCVRALCMCGL